jgi:hypothetical protein
MRQKNVEPRGGIIIFWLYIVYARTVICFRVPLLESIVEHGWCELVPKLLSFPEHESREKVLSLMWTLHEACHKEFSSHKRALESLKREYHNLSEQEVQDESGDGASDVSYFAELLQTIDNMLRVVSTIKDEL